MTPKNLATTLRAVADYVERWGLEATVTVIDDCIWVHVDRGMTRRAAESLTMVFGTPNTAWGRLAIADSFARVEWRRPLTRPWQAPSDLVAELPDPHAEIDAAFETDPVAGTSRIASDSDARSGDVATVEAAMAANPRRRVGAAS